MQDSYNKVFENNRQWVEKMTSTDADFFKNLAEGQSPEFLYIGCSDSRVPAEDLMGLKPGEIFIHRNIANVVNNIDMNVNSVIEYAVSHLKVKHIVVCGHYGCGGINAAMQSKDLGLLNPWLRSIRDVYRMHQEELDAITDQHQKFDRLVELNVQEQCINVIKAAAVQKGFVQNGFPVVHGWVFDLKTGKLKDLNIDFEGILHNIQKIYDLTESTWSVPKMEDQPQ